MKSSEEKKTDIQKERKTVDLKLLSFLAVESFVVILGFLIGVHGIGSMLVGHILYLCYLVIGVGLLLLAVWLNGGFDTAMPTEDDIVGNLTRQERSDLVQKIHRRKKLAKKVMFIDFPFLCCLLLDTIYVMLL